MLRAFTVTALAALVLCGTGSEPLAAPRTIAIVNLSENVGASEASGKVRDLLDKTPDLRPTTPGDLARALEDALPEGGVDAPTLRVAAEALAAGESAFIEFKSRQARAELDKARRALFSLAPGEQTNKLLADVSFQMALIHLREQNHGLAMGELQLLHRLESRDSIDPVRYPPDVVRAFKEARKGAFGGNSATISISATYDGAPVFIDGKAAGTSPLTIEVSAGAHIVAISAPQYQAAATMIDIDPGATQSHRIDLEPRSPVTRALELRFDARARGLGPEVLREAAARVSRLVGSDSVMLIVDGEDEGPKATLYIQHLDRLSYRHAVDDQLKRMLGLVLEVPRPTLLDGVREPGPVPWYKKTWGIAAIGGGTALTTVGLILLGASDNTKPTRTGAPGFDFPEP
jgi:hypothetical protein